MEENNLFILGETSPNFSFPIDPSFSTPSTNALGIPFVGEFISAPMENTVSPTFNLTHHQFVMGNQQTAPPPQIFDFIPNSSFSSLLPSNDMINSMGSFPTANSFNTPLANFPTTNRVSITANSSNTPLTLFKSPSLPTQNNRYMYNLQKEASLKSHHKLLPLLSTNLTLGNQASNYNVGYKLSNPYFTNAKQNYLHSMGNTGLDVSLNGHPLIKEPTRYYRCSICRVEFPTAQAYGGHMSSHSKAKKAKAKLEASMKEAKRARIDRETCPFLGLSDRACVSSVVKVEEEEVPEEGDVARKGKNIMRQTAKEAEEIQMEVPGYISDESVNSEFLLQLKQ